MPSQPRRATARSVGAVLGCALVFTAVPMWAGSPATAGLQPSSTATPRVPADASASTKAKLETAQQELTRIQKAAAQTNADYLAANARLSLARQSSIEAERTETEAQAVADQASRQVGQFASDAYRAGPLAGAVAVLSSDNPVEMLHTASMLGLVGDSQSVVLQRLEAARTTATNAGKQAQQARDDASSAAADARRLADLAHSQLTRAVELLTQLRAQANREAQKVQAQRLAAAQAAARKALAAGVAGLPPAAIAPGPQPGLPANAGPDPGEGLPGPDHLRPRTERAKAIITALFGVTDIGGWRPSDSVSDDHPNGNALDVMMSSGVPDQAHVELGWRIARWAQANSAALGVTYIIWQARIWSVERAAEGWRDYTVNFPYGSAVSPTTLHLNHVHISFG